MSTSRAPFWFGAIAVSCAISAPMSYAIAAEGAARAPAKPAKSVTPDLDFLEYLGTLEGDEENWTDLANMDLPVKPAKGAEPVKTNGATTGKGKSQSEADAKSAGNEK